MNRSSDLYSSVAFITLSLSCRDKIYTAICGVGLQLKEIQKDIC